MIFYRIIIVCKENQPQNSCNINNLKLNKISCGLYLLTCMWCVSISPGLTLLQHHCSYIPLWIKSLISKHWSVSFCFLVPNNKIPLKNLVLMGSKGLFQHQDHCHHQFLQVWHTDYRTDPHPPDQSAPGRQMLLAPRDHSMLQSLFFPKHHFWRVILALNI